MKINQIIGNHATGETLTLMISELDNNGGCNKYRVHLPPFTVGPPIHYHTDFSETFCVEKGALDFFLGHEHKSIQIDSGQRITADAGKLHRFSNPYQTAVMFTVTAQPAGGLVKAFQLAYGVANAGGAAPDGLPANKLVRLYFISLSRGYLPHIPLLFQKLVFNAAIWLLILTGRKRILDRYLN